VLQKLQSEKKPHKKQNNEVGGVTLLPIWKPAP
jgi:hypothetical protein